MTQELGAKDQTMTDCVYREEKLKNNKEYLYRLWFNYSRFIGFVGLSQVKNAASFVAQYVALPGAAFDKPNEQNLYLINIFKPRVWDFFI